MSEALQIILFIAAVAFIALVGCIIVVAFQALRQLQQLALTAENLKVNMQVLMQDSRELVRNVTDLSKRANQQIEDVSRIVRTVQDWAKRGDRLVNEVGSFIEPPVYSVTRNMNLARVGATAFLKVLFHQNKDKKIKKEKNHV